jgi:glycogen operon protein
MHPADPRTLGATLTEGGCNFAIWTNAADAVELCLFNEVNGMDISQVFAPVSDMDIASTVLGNLNMELVSMLQSC